jgi:hypothetical protein
MARRLKTITIQLDSELLCDFLNDNCTMLRDCDIHVVEVRANNSQFRANFDVTLDGREQNLAEFLLEMGYMEYQLHQLGIEDF